MKTPPKFRPAVHSCLKLREVPRDMYLAPFLTQQAANEKCCQAKINFILAYKNWEFYTKSFRLREERDRVVTTRIKTQ